ncbi:hypothetical protein [Lapillicoccus sp.]|uniref:hypothetical protein n=1 Tax=Lapillicoccus sp. TaxID=1909287 RepID=UPI003263BC9A
MPYQRSKLQQEVVEALVQSKAINLEAIAGVLSSYGERALLEGEDFATIINGNAVWNCGIGPVMNRANVSQFEQLGQQHV